MKKKKEKEKKKQGRFIPTLLASQAISLVEPVISLVVKRICGRGVRRA